MLTNKVPEKDVHDLFSRVAPNYDKMNDLISLGTQRLWRKKLFKKLAVKPGDFALDLCCGTGDLTIALAQQVGPSGNVVGLDFNEDMLALAYDKVLTAGVEKEVQLRQADAMNLPYEDESFNIVTIGFGLRNVPDANQVLREVYRVLKPGGKFAVLETSQPTNPIVKVGWKAYFKLFPKFAKLLHSNVSDYQYLSQTTNKFVSANQLKQMFEQAGYHDVSITKLNLGAGAIHIGIKN
ncbi:bifunctional demethylmenaquinone methyltransferase/2-methoxy-6-polyprenyl-1,4-benzoquinol methylase UbiE [Lactobacillus hominis]|uniref:Demethylmenaquinone methyltransferase n=1 Tax=Lactobacillus hominis DSM 23910 = CRBIP 24.179 TaxID=1423758 RepID=I7L9T7_9LACO|nr:bifunctional demethylmenaquinone methyltransferase/2-methoxy-6-polyprenyl-1,4-benzoquinol methylase UbiE [Lactobacillus hominis]KRM84931.1 ubiquinone menaquinone biosynthesis methyltransferase ubie [Lactobacillus hominis DSM 23910 = CRBIP 24.179]MCT3348131.1 bifunctional demethylmenaquinone methyltransferase/2-methoxy-6-polyprenyl-1,4-benzoquinol methylase UbiE [Lactobacillus hominis]CCI81669.1 Demethylmenaquinone methyltransferase [Lactobacillus hominis DSM 23910 = CRBIP 24.179]